MIWKQGDFETGRHCDFGIWGTIEMEEFLYFFERIKLILIIKFGVKIENQNSQRT